MRRLSFFFATLLCLAIPASVAAENTASNPESRTRRPLAELMSQVDTVVTPMLAQKKPDAAAWDALDTLTDDPTTLKVLAAVARDRDDETRARFLFARALEKQEINLYENFARSAAADALTLEFLGRFDESKKVWRESFDRDVLTTYVLLARFSVDPDANTLLDEAQDHVRTLVANVKAGNDATMLVTPRGSKRLLTMMSNDEAVAALKNGETLRYAYIDSLDLTGQTFEEPVGCQRCIVGELKGYNSTFKNRFSYRGFVLKDLNVGKSWTGAVNRSRSIPAATFDRVLLDKAVIFGDLKFDSVEITGPTGSFPFTLVEGEADFRNTIFAGTADFRYAFVRGPFALKGAKFGSAAYFGHLHAGGLDLTRVVSAKNPLLFDSSRFTGPVVASRCEFDRGATFENALFEAPFELHHCRISDRLNFSRARFRAKTDIAYIEVDDVDFFGAEARDTLTFADSVVRGNARFAVDGLNRRLHLENPHPLHRLYKQYQGDIDSDDELTQRSQYGVVHVDDLSARFHSDVSFANTIFEKFVGFEGVEFGAEDGGLANFYNAQFYGEAHFERTTFHSVADFRTISGNEISFNHARVDRTWMLDDANVPGRMSVNEMQFAPDATISFYGARLAYFGVTMNDVMSGNESRLFYESCVRNGPNTDDPRLVDARWDRQTETARTDETAIQARAREICLNHTIGEFVVLRDSFTSRGMTDEADWAYWNLRHYTNRLDRDTAQGLGKISAWAQWLLFEKAFGWGVHLINLFWTSLVVILVFMFLMRFLCGSMVVDWDDEPSQLKDLPHYALFVISLHSFLGRARDWKSKSSNKVWKVLYTSEMIIGILLITFFIGAYARIILR